MKTLKFIFTYIFYLACIFLVQAQVGINTNSPSGVFHVHVGNTASTANDIVVSSDGNLGIHQINPQAKLDLKGTFKITGVSDIPAGEEFTIVAESDGTFNISEPGKIPTVRGNIPSNLTSLPSLPISGTAVDYTTINIELPKGKWIVYFMATNWVNGTKRTWAVAESNVIKWQLINLATGNDDNIRADYSAAGFIYSYAFTAYIFLVDNDTGNVDGDNVTYYLRGASTAQNPLTFVQTADLWAEYYTTP